MLGNKLRNNAGGYVNHKIFWEIMKPYSEENKLPTNTLLYQAITNTFNSMDNFIDTFNAFATSLFGSGWTWLSVSPNQQLILENYQNQDSPISKGYIPILGLDVWEHACMCHVYYGYKSVHIYL